MIITNSNRNDAVDNKKSWKTVRPLLLTNLLPMKKIKLVDDEKIIVQDIEIIAELLLFFQTL